MNNNKRKYIILIMLSTVVAQIISCQYENDINKIMMVYVGQVQGYMEECG